MDTLSPLPSVSGLSAYGGCSGPAIKPIAQRCVSQIAKTTNLPIAGVGGLSTWQDAVEFMAVGARVLQLGTSVMVERFWDHQGFGQRLE